MMKEYCLELSPLQAQVEFFDADVFSDPAAAEKATDRNEPVLPSPTAWVTRPLILTPMPALLAVYISLSRPFLSLFGVSSSITESGCGTREVIT
ncbi:MAG: hypothetical protein AABN33_08915 [Acidobacteriota bacterium]